MRNYRTLTEEEVIRMGQLYPVTPNRELSKMFDVSLDAIQDYLAKPRGWKKDRKAVQIGSRGGKSLTEAQTQWIIKHYKHTKNRDIQERFGIGESTLHRLARKHGLKKSKQFARKVQRENAELGFAVCEEYGIYEQSAEYAREQWRLRKERGETLGFKKGESNKDRMSPRKFKALMERTNEKRRESIRKDRLRIKWGLEQKTRMRLVSGGKTRVSQRYAMRKRGYIVPRGSNVAYYTDDTVRNLAAEKRALAHGLHVEPYSNEK